MLLFNPISSSQVLTAAIKIIIIINKPRNLGEVISKEPDRNATSYISEEQEQTKQREALDNYAGPVQSQRYEFRCGLSQLIAIYTPMALFGKQAIRNGGNPPKPKTWVMSFCQFWSFFFWFVLWKYLAWGWSQFFFFFKTWNLCKSLMCKRE